MFLQRLVSGMFIQYDMLFNLLRPCVKSTCKNFEYETWGPFLEAPGNYRAP